MNTQTPKYWTQYKLLDFGNGVKIEQFNNKITIRPETNATNELTNSISYWQQKADYIYNSTTVDGGSWNKTNEAVWLITYKAEKINLKFQLSLSNSKHIGIFPEQAVNWEYIAPQISENNSVLNLFAYSGAISMVCAQAGANVTHVDSSKTAIKQAQENAKINNLNNIRFIIDDAFLFSKKEVIRKNKYNFIILDPPVYGFGAKGNNWKLTKDIEPLLKICKELLHKNGTIILNTYTPKFTVKHSLPIIYSVFSKACNLEFGKLSITDSFNKNLILSNYYIIKP